MDIGDYVLVAVIVLSVILVVGVLVLTFRRLRVIRRGGVDVSLRDRPDDSGRGWRLGVGHYRGDDFLWYRVLGLSMRPARVFSRAGLTVADRRPPSMPETYAMPQSATVLRFSVDDGARDGADTDIELAMGDDTMTGFLSWLESAPPGHSVYWAS